MGGTNHSTERTWGYALEKVACFANYLSESASWQLKFEHPVTLDQIYGNNEVFPCAEHVGVYFVLNKNQQILYIGKASAKSSIGRRLDTYFKSPPENSQKKWTTKWVWGTDPDQQPYYLAAIAVDEMSSDGRIPKYSWIAPALEEYLIANLSPPANTNQI